MITDQGPRGREGAILKFPNASGGCSDFAPLPLWLQLSRCVCTPVLSECEVYQLEDWTWRQRSSC